MHLWDSIMFPQVLFYTVVFIRHFTRAKEGVIRMGEQNMRTAMRVSRNTIIGNVVLFAFKFAAGLLGRSAAMLSDALHSLSDVLSTVIVMIGIKLAAKEPDSEHPYGHERFECVAAIILAAILFVTGLGLGYGGLERILTGSYEGLALPGVIALVAALVSIVSKEAMYWYTHAAAKKIDSGALMADAWHHRSDALSSIGSFAGILGARMGMPILDSIACLVICAFVLKAAIDVFRDAVAKITDKACDEELAGEIRDLILEQEDVLELDRLRTRIFGNRIYVDVEIAVYGQLTLHEGHEVAQRVHDAIEAQYPAVKHCMVHVNPAKTTQSYVL